MGKNIRFLRTESSSVNDFYPFFRKSLLQGWFLYSKNSADYILEVDYSEDLLRRSLLKANKYLYLSFTDEAVIGYLLVNKLNGGVGFANWLAVEPKLQRQGIASKLLDLWEEDVLTWGGHKLQLWTTENNLDFYKRKNFILSGEFPDSWYGVDHYFFYKTLRASDEKNFLKGFLKK